MNESKFTMTLEECGDECCAHHENEKPGHHSSGHSGESECDTDCGQMECNQEG